MDWRVIKKEWPAYRAKAQERWPKLSDEELEQIAGNRTRLIEKLREHYARTTEEATLEVDRWADEVTVSTE